MDEFGWLVLEGWPAACLMALYRIVGVGLHRMMVEACPSTAFAPIWMALELVTTQVVARQCTARCSQRVAQRHSGVRPH